MKIDGTKLLIYKENEPVGVLTGATFTTTRESIANHYGIKNEPISNYESATFTLEAAHKFDTITGIAFESMLLDYAWHFSKSLPRKKKKSFRTKFIKIIGLPIAYPKP